MIQHTFYNNHPNSTYRPSAFSPDIATSTTTDDIPATPTATTNAIATNTATTNANATNTATTNATAATATFTTSTTVQCIIRTRLHTMGRHSSSVTNSSHVTNTELAIVTTVNLSHVFTRGGARWLKYAGSHFHGLLSRNL